MYFKIKIFKRVFLPYAQSPTPTRQQGKPGVQKTRRTVYNCVESFVLDRHDLAI